MSSQSSSQDLPQISAWDVPKVYMRHADDVERWAARLGGPLVDTEEVVQEVMIVVQRRLPDFRRESDITTWLYGITHNIARKRRQRERLRRWIKGLPADYTRDLASHDLLPIEELERKQAAAAVYAALDTLDEKYRNVLILYEIEGLPGEEIARLTGTKLATVWVWLHRGRQQFKRRFEKVQKQQDKEGRS